MRPLLRKFWLPLLVAAPLAAFAAPPETAAAEPYRAAIVEPEAPLSLDAALALTLRGNVALSAALHDVAAADASVVQAGMLPNPELAALAEDRQRDTRTTTLQINQRLLLGGKRSARQRAAAAAREVADVDRVATEAEVRAEVIGAFFDVLIAQERARLAQVSADLAQRGSAIASKRVAAGKVSPLEATRAHVAEAGAKVELAQAASALRLQRQRLAACWGNPAPRFTLASGDIAALPQPEALDAILKRLDNTPGLRRATLELEQYRALTEVERSNRIPDVTLSVGSKRDEQLGRNQAIVGFSLPIPLFDRNQGNLGVAVQREAKARDELAAAQVRIRREATRAWEALTLAHEETAALERDVLPGAQSALDAASKGFEYGKFGFIDVLDAQRTLFQSRAQYLRALATTHEARAELDRILGERFSAIAQP